MDKKYSIGQGFNNGWLQKCAGGKYSQARKKEVKELSSADFKHFRRGISDWGGKNARGCGDVAGVKKWQEEYIAELKRKVEAKVGEKKIYSSRC